MKFDKSKVYTALTADELQPGDIVITADNLHSLMIKVIQYSEVTIRPLEKIRPIWYVHRFHTIYGDFVLAYLVERKENCTNCDGCEYKDKEWMKKNKDYLINRCENYKPKTNRNLCDSCKHCFAECPATPDDIIFGVGIGNDNVYSCAKYELKAEKHYRPFRDVDELIGAWKNKMWGGFNKNTMPLIWVQRKESPKFKLLITEYDMCFQHLAVGNVWKDLEGLFNNYTFLDGSPCGVEE